VFADLARLAGTLSGEVKLGGWLHRRTWHVATSLMRGERRRQHRERQVVESNDFQNPSGGDFERIAPLLDEAINELDDRDRAVIVLRFFEHRDLRAIGEMLGSNEDAAQKRVARAWRSCAGISRGGGWSPRPSGWPRCWPPTPFTPPPPGWLPP
jgi:RNA polymerase sigma factor (sigma-70 family)